MPNELTPTISDPGHRNPGHSPPPPTPTIITDAAGFRWSQTVDPFTGSWSRTALTPDRDGQYRSKHGRDHGLVSQVPAGVDPVLFVLGWACALIPEVAPTTPADLANRLQSQFPDLDPATILKATTLYFIRSNAAAVYASTQAAKPRKDGF